MVEFGFYIFEGLMLSVQTIEDAIQKLPEPDLAELQRWFSEFYGNIWNNKIEHDAQSGKLDDLAAEALAEYHSGLVTEL